MREKKRKDIYEVITNRIIEKLEQGTIPWRRPWIGGTPKNLISKKDYRGINSLILGSAGYKSALFLTFKQAKDQGGNVKKGEKGFPVIFWNFIDKRNPDAKEGEVCSSDKRIPYIRNYTVFNVDQCEGLEIPEEDNYSRPLNPIAEAESVVVNMPRKPLIESKQQRACYSPDLDRVNMPASDSFLSDEEYYCTLFHELTHSTGHETRLGREELTKMVAFGDHSYSKEELVAEMGAAMLCGFSGIENTIDNSAAYINGWLSKLRNNKKLLIQAAGKAQRATDFILGTKFEEATK